MEDKTTRDQLAKAMREAREAYPVTIEFEDGTTKVCRTHREVPRGIPFRTAGSGEAFTVVESI